MIGLIDLTVLLDVIQTRQPHYSDSASVLSAARNHEFQALLPVHAITTAHYIIERSSGALAATAALDWLLQHFDMPASDKSVLVRARNLDFADYEDAVVASIAERSGCDYIITRNVADFRHSPVTAVTPAEFLNVLHPRA
jgi:hypothetical protein